MQIVSVSMQLSFTSARSNERHQCAENHCRAKRWFSHLDFTFYCIDLAWVLLYFIYSFHSIGLEIKSQPIPSLFEFPLFGYLDGMKINKLPVLSSLKAFALPTKWANNASH